MSAKVDMCNLNCEKLYFYQHCTNIFITAIIYHQTHIVYFWPRPRARFIYIYYCYQHYIVEKSVFSSFISALEKLLYTFANIDSGFKRDPK